MIHAITGKPGGGKSLLCMRLLVDALREDAACQVVTNVPVLLDELNAYVQRKWPEENLRVCERVTLIADEDVRDFYRHRGNVLGVGGEVERTAVVEDWDEASEYKVKEGSKGFERVRYSTTHPVTYFLDEFHLAYNAREWARVGKSALWYASQHRKLGDTVYWVTQYTENVDKQFRVLTQDWTMCRNWANETWFSFVRPPARFQIQTSLEPPTTARRAMSSWSVVGLDLELAACYRTMQGTGIAGKLAPNRLRRKGLGVLPSVAAALVGVLALAVGIPILLGKGIGAAARGMVAQTNGGLPAAVGGLVAGPAPGRTVEVAASQVAAPESPKVPELRVTVVCGLPGSVMLGLSDGRMLRAGDYALEWVHLHDRACKLRGGPVLTW